MQLFISLHIFKYIFFIHTDARNFQLGAVIIQRGKKIALYSRKLNGL